MHNVCSRKKSNSIKRNNILFKDIIVGKNDCIENSNYENIGKLFNQDDYLLII